MNDTSETRVLAGTGVSETGEINRLIHGDSGYAGTVTTHSRPDHLFSIPYTVDELEPCLAVSFCGCLAHTTYKRQQPTYHGALDMVYLSPAVLAADEIDGATGVAAEIAAVPKEAIDGLNRALRQPQASRAAADVLQIQQSA